MTDAATDERVVVRRKAHWSRRLLSELVALLLALAILLAAALVVLDTGPGHRFIVDRLQKFESASGIRIRVGRIEGSIFGEARLKQFALLDRKGVWLSSPEVTIDWAPGAWLYNKLDIDRLEADRVVLHRRPELKPSTKKGPLLPGFDIHIGQLDIRRLEVLPAVAGRAYVGRLAGEADVRAGRALVRLGAVTSAGDRLQAAIDAEPDRDRFDLDVKLAAPAGGVIPALVGSRRAMTLDINGAGRWTEWRGAAKLGLSGMAAADLRLVNRSGRFALSGMAWPSRLTKGKLARLAGPAVRVAGDARLVDRKLDGEVRLTSSALRAVARGGIDLAGSRYDRLRLGVDLLRPSALFPNMRGQKVRLLWTLDGPFGRADYSYRLTSDRVFFDDIGLAGLMANGRGRAGPWPMRVPIRAGAGAISGVGDVAGGILRNISIDGMLEVTPKFVRGEGLRLKSDKLTGELALLIDLATGRFDISISGGLKRYLIPGLGVVDVVTRLKVVPGPNGKARVTGTAEAWVRRLDNKFFASLAGGLPHLTTNLERGADGVLHFTNLRLNAPKIALVGQGYRLKNGIFHIEARGRQAQYGPIASLVLDGKIERPTVSLLLPSPADSLGLRDVRLYLVPAAYGYDYRAAGGSRLGPFTSTGRILMPKGADTVIEVAALDVAGSRATGRLVSRAGGFDGALDVAGGGIEGRLGFVPVDGDQRIDVRLALANANLPGPPPIRVRAGRIDGSVLLADGRTTLDGTIQARGLEASGVSLARLTASAKMTDGSGQVRASLAGRRGSAFEFVALADVAPGRIRVNGRGSVDRKLLVLDSPLVLTRDGDGWEAAPTRISFGGGKATLSGRTGSRPELHAQVAAMPLTLLDMGWPKLGLAGIASGRLDLDWSGDRPSGSMDMKVRGLSRSGLVLASQPIDLGIAAKLANGQAAFRAVAVSGGKTVGRAQGRFAPMRGGSIVAALLDAPMQVQLRYAGPADTLWRLSGIEIFDLSGPISVGADIGGRMVDPVIRGAVQARGARLESAVTGTVVEGLTASGRFDGSRLTLSSLSGTTPGGGRIAGNGSVDFAGGAAVDLNLTTARARILDRDDIRADVSGPLRIKSEGRGGTISGNLRLDDGRFQLGRATAKSKVPQLKVRDVGVDPAEVIEIEQIAPWRLAVAVDGNLRVTGLGIDSRWSADLDVGGTADSPALRGTANLIRGTYDFAGRSFRLERGKLTFRGESPPDPLLDIRAEAQVQGLDAAVTVRGTGLKPEIAFSSVPAMPQEELLARLLFGTSITNLSAPEALQLATAVTALQSGSGALDPINAVRRAVGLDRLRIIPADIATGQKTAVSAGKYIGRKLFVEVITDGQGYSATRIEYQVTRWLSLLSSISTIGRTSANVRVSKDY